MKKVLFTVALYALCVTSLVSAVQKCTIVTSDNQEFVYSNELVD